MCFPPVHYPSDYELLDEGVDVLPTSPHVGIARRRKKYAAANEPRYIFSPRSTALARCFSDGVLHSQDMEQVHGLMMVMSSRSALFLRRGWLSKSASASVVMSICRGFNQPFCVLALSRESFIY